LPILKAEARSAVIANCLALQQHFAVIYRFPLCLMVGGWVAGRLVGWENAVGKILWKFGVEYCCMCELSFIVVYFRGKYLCSPAFRLSFIGDYFLPVDFAVYHGELAL